MSAETCIVTGAAGFIGSHLVDRLLSLGHRVVGVDNLLLGRTANLHSAFENANFSFRQIDVNDYAACLRYLKKQSPRTGYQTVWHLAANSDIQAGGNNPAVDLQATFLTTFNVLKMMQALNIPRLAFASSSAIYGDFPGVLREDSGPLFPVSNYGAMKLASEGVITAALPRFLERAWIFRFPNVVGGRSTHGVIYDFLKKLKRSPGELEVLGDGCQTKPYLHVKELVDAMIFIFERTTQPLNYFNIAPPRTATTVKSIAEAVVAVAAPGARIRYTGGSRGWVGDVPRFRYSVSKLAKLGWTPKLSSNAAVHLAIREMLASP